MRPLEELEYFKAKYPDEKAIYVQKKETVDYSIIDDSVITTIKVYSELLQLSDNGGFYSKDNVYSSSFSKASDIKAYTLVPGKKKYQKVEVTEFKETFDKDSYIFYDDSKEIKFTYPSVQKGAKLVLEYTRTVKEPKLMGLFYFDTYIPIDKATYIVRHDNEIKVNPQFFNKKSFEITKNEEPLGDARTQLTLRATQLPKIKFESQSPSYSYLATSVYCPVEWYENQSGSIVEVISTTENLHQWYRSFIKDLHGNEDEVKALVETIVSPEDPVMEKVKKIYYWVQANIKYIAFEDGMRGFIPHEGSYVIGKRYGDCKDMASTIVSMLREAGVNAQYTWVGSRKLPYKYSETPSPITDNHMIATFENDGTTYYLDATGSYTPIDLPTSMIQGKQCLISMDNENYIINEVPIIPKEKSVMADSVEIVLEDGVLKGTGSTVLTGYLKVFSTYKLIKSSQKSIDNYVKVLLNKGNNKFTIDEYETKNVDDLNHPILIDYEFTVPDYYREIGNKIYINLVLDKLLTDELIENRFVSLENEYKYINRNVVKLKIPEGYEVQRLPDNVSGSNNNFGYSIDYKVTDTEIIVTKEFYEDYLIMEPEAFDSWNAVISEYSKACRKAVTLIKNTDNK